VLQESALNGERDRALEWQKQQEKEKRRDSPFDEA